MSSVDRIRTTHVGRLERPQALSDLMDADPRGRPTTPAFGQALAAAVTDVVREQRAAGLDVVTDGEFGKISWYSYLSGRLGGFEQLDRPPLFQGGQDRRDFADYYAWSGGAYYRSPGDEGHSGPQWTCTGPVTYTGRAALDEDIANLKAAMAACGATEGFLPATAPGSVPWENLHYADDEAYLAALADALSEEYRAIVDAGLIVQIDDPYISNMWDQMLPDIDMDAFHAYTDLRVEALNRALEGIPADRVRVHVCWGSWHGPHSTDVPLAAITPLLLRMNVGGYSFEAANVRHEHEREVWRDVRLPEDRVLVPGVVSHATDTIEHPELVAARIRAFADIVGPERVVASTDCGFGYRVHPQITWAKLRALSEGAALASATLAGR